MKRKVYLAARAHRAEWVSALVAAGLPLASNWHLWFPNRSEAVPTAQEWSEHSARCLSQAASADICLLVLERDTLGTLLEAGAALGAGKVVYLVNKTGEPAPFLECHPRVRCFRSLPDAIAALRQ
jgi:hypothetical protein